MGGRHTAKVRDEGDKMLLGRRAGVMPGRVGPVLAAHTIYLRGEKERRAQQQGEVAGL